MALIDIKVPDIGDFKDVAVIELLVKAGDTVKAEQSLVTVESDKASMEIPSSAAGVVKEMKVRVGDRVRVRVLGVDRFDPPHDRGSSHGGSRVIRLSYFEHSDYVPLLRRAYEGFDPRRVAPLVDFSLTGPCRATIRPAPRRAASWCRCVI